MIALIIIGAVVLLIAVLLSLPLVFVIDYEKEAEIKMRLLFFNLFKEKEPSKQKRRKRVKKKLNKYRKFAKRRDDPAWSSDNTGPAKLSGTPHRVSPTSAPKKEKSLTKNIPDLDIKMLKMLVESVKHPIKKLIKKIKITELNINSTVGGDDAAKVAINFGLQNAAIHSAVAWLDSIANVKVEKINIQADFMNEVSDFAIHCKVKIKTGTVLVCLLAFMLKIAKLNAGGGENQKQNRATPRRSGGVGKTIRIVLD